MPRSIIGILSSILLSCVLPLIVQCGATTEPILQGTPVPSGVEVLSITEAETVTNEVHQKKTFDQCDSASPFAAEIQFSQSASEEVREELVLETAAEGTAGVSGIASVKIAGSLGQHFTSRSRTGKAHEEEVRIEVQPHSKQEYTLVWQESWRNGIVQYLENGEVKTANYSYRIGLELVSSKGTDLPCPGQDAALVSPTEIPAEPTATLAPPATATSEADPTETAQAPTPLPAPTSPPDIAPGSILEVGDEWRQNGVGLRLTHYELNPASYWGHNLGVGFEFRNYTDSDLVVAYSKNDFLAATDSGQSLKVLGFYNKSFWCNETTVVVEAGARYNIVDDADCGGGTLLWITVELGNPNLSEVIIRVTSFSRITDARWRIVFNR